MPSTAARRGIASVTGADPLPRVVNRTRSPVIRARTILPGFGLSFGVTLSYLGLIVLLPLACLLWKASGLGLAGFWQILSAPRLLAAI